MSFEVRGWKIDKCKRSLGSFSAWWEQRVAKCQKPAESSLLESSGSFSTESLRELFHSENKLPHSGVPEGLAGPGDCVCVYETEPHADARDFEIEGKELELKSKSHGCGAGLTIHGWRQVAVAVGKQARKCCRRRGRRVSMQAQRRHAGAEHPEKVEFSAGRCG